MEHKNIVATIYLKDGQAVASMKDFTPVEDVYKLCQLYNDSGIDKIIIFDLSTSDEEHEKNIHTIENINRNIEIKVCAGGNINRLEDVKKLESGFRTKITVPVTSKAAPVQQSVNKFNNFPQRSYNFDDSKDDLIIINQ